MPRILLINSKLNKSFYKKVENKVQLNMKLPLRRPPEDLEYEIENENSLLENSSVVELRFEKSQKEKIKNWLTLGGSMILSSLIVLIIPIFNLFQGKFIYSQDRNHTETTTENNSIDWRTDLTYFLKEL